MKVIEVTIQILVNLKSQPMVELRESSKLHSTRRMGLSLREIIAGFC